jgi:hypothetical protein
MNKAYKLSLWILQQDPGNESGLAPRAAKGDFSERRSLIDFPPGFDDYVQRSYTALKAEQQRLLHSTAWNIYYRLFHR